MNRLFRFVAAASVGVLTLAVSPTTVVHAASCSTVPLGVASTSTDPEPGVTFWCLDPSTLAAPLMTGVPDNFGGYVDPFGETLSNAAHLNDGEAGYRTEALGGTNNADHAITQGGYFVGEFSKDSSTQGTVLTPDRAFHFQNGKLVMEADVAAGTFGFMDSSGGDVAWPEVDWSTSELSGNVVEGLYGFGYYGGNWSAGCRLQAHHSLTCSIEDGSATADRPLPGETQDQGPCFPADPNRVMEMSGFESCGPKHFGFAEDFGAPKGVFRSCAQNAANGIDGCLDRFRLEWSQAGFVAYVNGVKFAEDSGWDANHQLPASIVNGSTPVYAHFVDFSDFNAPPPAVRVHWQRIAVNPHDANGNLLPPSASPTFGQTPPSPTPTPTPSPTPTATPTPVPATKLVCPVVANPVVGQQVTCTYQ